MAQTPRTPGNRDRQERIIDTAKILLESEAVKKSSVASHMKIHLKSVIELAEGQMEELELYRERFKKYNILMDSKDASDPYK